jgi:hypothetical protein
VIRQQVDREIAVAQLPHPGKEWWPDKGTLKRGWTDWNDGHARKFLLHRGTYLDEQGKPIEAPITFWGEWEGPSNFRPTGTAGNGMPAWFQVPRRGDLGTSRRPQNTDPFVFGAFLYSNCMEDHEWPKGSGLFRRGAMSRLAPGSVVLFGSTRAGKFLLDTCLVIADVIDIDNLHYEEQTRHRVPDAFVDATLRPIFTGVRSRELSLYVGAEYKRSSEPFSFFPCLPTRVEPLAFPRPAIHPEGALAGVINPKSSRRFRRYPCDLSRAIDAWTEVRNQVVQSHGINCGVYADPL